MLTALELLRVTPASPKPGAPRDRSLASQGHRLHSDHRPDPARDRPAHEAGTPASSPRVPDARRNARPPPRRRYLLGNKLDGPIPTEFGQLTKLQQLRVPPASPKPGAAARPPFGVAGGSRTTRSPARSRSKPATSRGTAATPRLRIPTSPRRAAQGSAATGHPVSASRVRRSAMAATATAAMATAMAATATTTEENTATAATARSRSPASPTIPRRQQSCELPPRPRRPTRRATAPHGAGGSTTTRSPARSRP